MLYYIQEELTLSEKCTLKTESHPYRYSTWTVRRWSPPGAGQVVETPSERRLGSVRQVDYKIGRSNNYGKIYNECAGSVPEDGD